MEDLDQNPGAAMELEEAKGRSNKTRIGILVLAVGLAVGYMIYAAFPGNALYFMTVTEFMNKAEAQDGRTVRVAGKLVDGSFQQASESNVWSFQLIDKDAESASVNLAASYQGVVPDLFFNPHSEVILQGSYGPGRIFEADTILVKCPSKYQALEEEFPDGYYPASS